MEATFTLEKNDLRRVWQWARTPPLGIGIGLAVTVILQITLVTLLTHDDLLGVALALVTAPFYIGGILWRNRRLGGAAAEKALSQEARLIGLRTVRLESDRLHLILPLQRETQVTPWTDVQGLYRHSRYLLVLLPNKSILPIPLRAFADRNGAELFWTALLAYKMSGGEAAASFPADDAIWPPAPRQS